MTRARKKDKKLVVDILVEAFESLKGDNCINSVVNQDERRTERMQVLMEYLFDKAMRTGAIFLSDNRASCRLISYPHKDKISILKFSSILRLTFECIGINRVGKVLKRQKMVQRNSPSGKHIRPLIFAVKKEYKGTSTAAKLIMQVFEDFKENLLAVIVDTVSEDLKRLYKKFGLKIYNIEEKLGFPIYLFRMN